MHFHPYGWAAGPCELIDSDRPILSLRDGLFSTLTAQITRRRDAKKSRPDVERPVFLNSERLKVSLRHPEHHVALERVLGCLHFDRAGGRA
jgi:hypothetical protein